MKKSINAISLTILILIFVMCMNSCMIIEKSWIKREKEYYSDKSNFIFCNGKITYLKYNNGSIYLGMDIDKLYNFSDGTFELNYENSLIVKELGFENDIHLGDEISFISAPKYFGDGYIYPIVGISKDGKIYLDFETGYENLMKQYE